MKHIICIISMLAFGCAAVSPSNRPFKNQVKSWQEIKRQYCVIQSEDFSCGSGALATLLRYYFGIDANEEEILHIVFANLNETEAQNRMKLGLTLLDLKKAAEKLGFQAKGVRLSLTYLTRLKQPILVYLERETITHFAVLRGVKGDRVYLADPSQGNICVSIRNFAKEWPGYGLILQKQGFVPPSKHPLSIEGRPLGEWSAIRRMLPK